MFIIKAVEYDRKKGVPVGEPLDVEFHHSKTDASAYMTYFASLFGKHYQFYIVER